MDFIKNTGKNFNKQWKVHPSRTIDTNNKMPRISLYDSTIKAKMSGN